MSMQIIVEKGHPDTTFVSITECLAYKYRTWNGGLMSKEKQKSRVWKAIKFFFIDQAVLAI